MLKYQVLVLYTTLVSYLIRLFFKEPNIADAIVLVSLASICGLVTFLNKNDTEGVQEITDKMNKLTERFETKIQDLEDNAMSIEHYREIKSDLEGMRDITGQINMANIIGKSNDFKF